MHVYRRHRPGPLPGLLTAGFDLFDPNASPRVTLPSHAAENWLERVAHSRARANRFTDHHQVSNSVTKVSSVLSL